MPKPTTNDDGKDNSGLILYDYTVSPKVASVWQLESFNPFLPDITIPAKWSDDVTLTYEGSYILLTPFKQEISIEQDNILESESLSISDSVDADGGIRRKADL